MKVASWSDPIWLQRTYAATIVEVSSRLIDADGVSSGIMAVQECAVVGAPDDERGEIVKAFLVLRPTYDESDALIAELQAHAKAVTAPYKYPRAIEFIDELPKTMTGKILRRTPKDLEIKRTHTV